MEEAEVFLNLIARESRGSHCFQTFCDFDSKNKRLAKIINRSFSEVKDQLKKLNEQGAGVFVAINKLDGKGRRKKNVLRPRAVFADFDNVEMPEFPLKPSIVVQSKNGNHAYWLLKDGEALDRFKGVQKAIAAKYGSDPSINDEVRVMRVPGFNHCKDKDDPYLVKLLEVNENEYTFDEVEVGLKLLDEGYEDFRAWAFESKPKKRNEALTAILREGIARGFKKQTLIRFIGEFCTEYDFDQEEAQECLEYQLKYNKEGRFETRVNIVAQAKLEFKKLSTLLSEPDKIINWLVDKLFNDAGLSLLVSAPKQGKSTLVRNLAMCVAKGLDFLGRSTTKGAVLYLALEEQEEQVKQHFRSMGCDGSEDIYIHSFVAPKDCFRQLQDAIKEYQPKLVIIDTLFKFVRIADSSDYMDVTSSLEPLLALGRSTGCHIVGIHHSKKAKGGSPEDNILGSQGIFGAVDTALFMESNSSGKRVISSVQRYGNPIEPHILEMDEKTGRIVMTDSKKEFDEKSMQRRIFYTLSEAEFRHETFTEPELHKLVGGKTKTYRKALRACVEAKTIVKYGSGKKSSPFKYGIHPEVFCKGEKEHE